MPTFRHGKSTGFLLENKLGSLVDISTYVREVTFPRTIDMPETTTFQSTAKTYVQGIADGKFSMSGLFDATGDALFSGLARSDGPPSTASADTYGKGKSYGFVFKFAPEGVAVGRTLYVGRVFVSNYSVQGSVRDMVAAQIDFVFSGQKAYTGDAGPLVRTTISALSGTDAVGIWNAQAVV